MRILDIQSPKPYIDVEKREREYMLKSNAMKRDMSGQATIAYDEFLAKGGVIIVVPRSKKKIPKTFRNDRGSAFNIGSKKMSLKNQGVWARRQRKMSSRWYGSINNRLWENLQVIEPAKGVGVTFYSWSDRHAGTIQKVWTEGIYTFIGITEDSAKRIDNNGMSESQTYEYTEVPDGHLHIYRRKTDNPNDPWRKVLISERTGRWKLHNDRSISIGWREAYYDFSFQKKGELS